MAVDILFFETVPLLRALLETVPLLRANPTSSFCFQYKAGTERWTTRTKLQRHQQIKYIID